MENNGSDHFINHCCSIICAFSKFRQKVQIPSLAPFSFSGTYANHPAKLQHPVTTILIFSARPNTFKGVNSDKVFPFLILFLPMLKNFLANLARNHFPKNSRLNTPRSSTTNLNFGWI